MSRNRRDSQAWSCAPLMMSTANGAVTISVTMPYQSLRCDARARAPALGRYPRVWTASRMRCLVSSEMLAFSRLLRTKDTAVRDTPAALATSAMVTPRCAGATETALETPGAVRAGAAVFDAAACVLFAIECSESLASAGHPGQLKPTTNARYFERVI